MQKFEPSELKALFGQLVDAVGTQEAAATFLGVSRQRIGQLISTGTGDLPTFAQVFKLEQVVGHSIVFAAFARRVDGEAGKGALAASVASTAAASHALSVVHAAKADGVLESQEIEAVRNAARENLEAAQRQFDETMALRPTLRVVA
ncbi:MAG: hypothetical protein DI531_15515 [Brevundimonas sp.]|uniref:hypothetical protein n=1 Tax=Brevundimonas sp. TaxID=1871086 RepID=UPI000DB0BFBA|nr:hypothetical protein [Brevundimonas sp.]PZU71671.1 MAG: hypothetical protein DI531_15515 [Brevundimonas sp.]